MLQTIARAITRFISFAFENLVEMFIRLVLEEFALFDNTCIIGIIGNSAK